MNNFFRRKFWKVQPKGVNSRAAPAEMQKRNIFDSSWKFGKAAYLCNHKTEKHMNPTLVIEWKEYTIVLSMFVEKYKIVEIEWVETCKTENGEAVDDNIEIAEFVQNYINTLKQIVRFIP